MQHEVKKVTLIVNELMTLLLLNNAEEIDIKIKHVGEHSEIYFIYRQCKFDDKLIEKIKYNLNIQRQSEVEGYYWQLVGDDDSGDELHLVGAMIDEAKIEMKDKDLHIHLIRNK